MELIYPELIPHHFIGDKKSILKSIIVTNPQLLETFGSSPVLLIEESQLPIVLRFYQANFYTKNMIVHATSKHEAVQAITYGYRFTYLGEKVDARNTKLSASEKRLLKLKFAPDELQKYLAKSVLLHELKQYPLTSIEQTVRLVCDTNKAISFDWALGFANWFVDTLKRKTISRYQLTKPDEVFNRWAPLAKMQEFTQERVILNGSDTGTGKTELNVKLINHFIKQGLKVAYISHRKSIAKGLMGIEELRQEGISHYENVLPGTEQEINCLNIVVNSVVKPNFSEYLNQVDIVILEEGKQVLEHLVRGTVKHPENLYYRLQNICNNAKTIIVTDADINDSTLKFFVNAVPNKNVRYLFNKANFKDKTVKISRYQQLLEELRNYKGDQPIMVCGDSKAELNDLAKNYRSIDLKVLCITSDDNKTSKEIEAFNKSPNTKSLKYDVILYSPCITSSTSITNSKFKQHYGLFMGNVCSSTVIQMLRRNRACKHFKVGIKNQVFTVKQTGNEFIKASQSEEFNEFSKAIKEQQKFNCQHLIPSLFFEARDKGFNVEVDVEKSFMPTKAQLKKIGKELSDEAYINGVLSASSNIDLQQENITSYYFQTVRKEIENTFRKEDITAQEIKLWNRGKLKNQLAKFTYMMEHFNNFKTIFSCLNIDIFKLSGTFDEEDALAFFKLLVKDHNLCKELGIKAQLSTPPKYPRMFANNLLKKFGIETTTDQVGTPPNRARISQVCPKSIAEMKALYFKHCELSIAA